MKKFFAISDEVQQALHEGKPVVALESTIISYGMPYPLNYETAVRASEIVREGGAVPATIAIIGGVVKIGLTLEELEFIAKKEKDIIRVSHRDIPAVIACGYDGATTVSATMVIANLAGIRVFATGGIGGVHKDATKTMDISADLDELSRTPVVVVCSGAKAILDLRLTKEYLETKGVPVYGYQTTQMPAFYSKTSGINADYCVEDANTMAKIIKISDQMKMKSGMLLTVPIPDEYAIQEHYINAIINQATESADEHGIKGKDFTPYMLAKVAELTGGKSIQANVQLFLNNARVASEVAVELSKM